MSERTGDYVPAAGRDWLLPLYDPVSRLLGEGRDKRRLLAEAEIPAGGRVLEVGCGTGTLTVLAKQRHPDAQVVGFDPDPKALAIARRKAAHRGVDVRFEQGFSQALPFPDASFDRVLSSMMLHHLEPDVKRDTFREVRRVLRPSGRLHVLDFGPPGPGRLARLARPLMARHASVRDNLEGRLEGMMREGGLSDVRETGRQPGLFWSFSFYRAAAA